MISGTPGIRPLEIVLDTEEPESRWQIQPEIRLRLHEIPARAPLLLPPEEQSRLNFRMLPTPPDRFEAASPPREVHIDDTALILATPPSSIEWIIPPGSRTLTGMFAMASGSRGHERESDGATFTIDWVAAEGGESRRLSEWTLQPVTSTSDRGLHSFEVALPLSPGRAILQTGPGATGDANADLTAWGGHHIPVTGRFHGKVPEADLMRRPAFSERRQSNRTRP